VAIVGAGGVGGLLAVMLARVGHDVRVMARAASLRAIRERGIRTRGPDGEHHAVIARASDDAAELGAVDLVLVTVKAWQLAELGPRLVPLIGPATLVVPMQNGVEASEVLAGALGEDHVIGGVCRVISWAEQPGEIRWIGGTPSLTLGARQPAQREAVEACAATLRAAGVEVIVSAEIERARWLKFQFIAAYSAVGAAARLPLGELRQDPQARGQLEAVMHEVGAVAAARGVVLGAKAVEKTMQRIDVLPADATASMHRDLVAGRPSELHELIGAVVRLGREANVATPVSAALYATLEPLERQARAR